MTNTFSDDQLRSLYVRDLISEPSRVEVAGEGDLPPRRIYQYWHDSRSIPPDVQRCIDSWSVLDKVGFQRELYDDRKASEYIETHLGRPHARAFAACPHPAMRSDYFRYSIIYVSGGFYIDADDVYLGAPIESLFSDGRLKLNPLCYNLTKHSMSDAREAAKLPDSESYIFYTDTTPLIAPAKHPIIGRALLTAFSNVTSSADGSRDVQSITGPGNLTKALVNHAIEQRRDGRETDFFFIKNWSQISRSQWPLDYRSDLRNWRLWEQQET